MSAPLLADAAMCEDASVRGLLAWGEALVPQEARAMYAG
jgi:hypothetical protein